MTDLDALKFAAKAAGLNAFVRAGGDVAYDEKRGLAIDGAASWWNPLKNNSHALRLAVALRLIVDPFGAEHGCTVKHRPEGSRRAKELWSCGTKGDDCASTRRAIVFAAAKLGQSLAATSSGDSR